MSDLGNGQQLTWQETGLEKHACACVRAPPSVCSLMPILISPLQIQLLRSLTKHVCSAHAFYGTENPADHGRFLSLPQEIQTSRGGDR